MSKYKNNRGTSLVAWWLRICLPMQGPRVQALVREYPTCLRATKPVYHKYWACALEPVSHNYWARMLQLLKSARLELVLRNKRNHSNKKTAHLNKEWPPLTATRESLHAARPNTAKNQSINKILKKHKKQQQRRWPRWPWRRVTTIRG